ncbi:hypothetical protein [Paenibacillus macquariensis]|uniref:Immunity protein 63 n=1 Tax=Paenibacillus macquariensis TaxID=948756 RepID=A0ABY1KF35_9BACL|nr:hypothetical protein [Paenibacillus macquariensis]OAB35443.1 hypothetical protein PMSM_09305 [Paenibacillus macquariensis subsp. macquariensis]SIR74568.1 hypothetical protein SAMN05421578_1618 [Paenibacillus macquariensis]
MNQKDFITEIRDIFEDSVYKENKVLCQKEPIDGVCFFQYTEDSVHKITYWISGINEMIEVSPYSQNGAIMEDTYSYQSWCCPNSYEQSLKYLKLRYEGRKLFEYTTERIEKLSKDTRSYLKTRKNL